MASPVGDVRFTHDGSRHMRLDGTIGCRPGGVRFPSGGEGARAVRTQPVAVGRFRPARRDQAWSQLVLREHGASGVEGLLQRVPHGGSAYA